MWLFGKDDGLQAELRRGLAEHFGELPATDDADGGRDGIFGRTRSFIFFGWLDLGFCHDAVCTNVRGADTARVFCDESMRSSANVSGAKVVVAWIRIALRKY